MNLKRLRVVTVACCLLPVAGSSHALSYIVNPTNVQILTNTQNAAFRAVYAPASRFEYFTPSVVSYATLDTVTILPPAAGLTGHFPGLGNFFSYEFGPGDGAGDFTGPTDLIQVTYNIAGDVGYSDTDVAFSTATLTSTSVLDVSGANAGAASVTDLDPNNGEAALRLDLEYGGVPVHIWIDDISSIPAPGSAELSISGYVTDSLTPVVPEPGAVALLASLLGLGLVGSLARLRRRRRQ